MDDCIFCKIIKGDIPSKKVYEDENILAFHDIHPETPVHVLIIPKQHISGVSDVNSENSAVIAKIFEAANIIADKLGIAESGFRLITNNGANAGQTVFHLHFHLLGGKSLGTKLLG